MKNKTICLVAPSLQVGGIERSLTTLSVHFVKRGYKVVYIACRAGCHFYDLSPQVIFREPSFSFNASTFCKIISYYRMIRFVRKQFKEFEPDAILSFGDIINPVALLANRGLRYPIFISDRTSPKQNLGRLKNFMKHLTYSKATGIIAQSSSAADYKRLVFGNNINLRVIPNSLRKISDDIVLDKKKWVIGVGRLSREKGFDRLIEAFAKVKGHDDWQLVLAGAGPVMEQLKLQAKVLGVASRVQFLGKSKDVDVLFKQSMLFVIPSRFEGFPNALCEAMASPLPCIAFDSIAADLIENHVNGVVVRDGDIQGLADEMIKLMDDKSLREKYAANAIHIRERLDPDIIGDEFLDFIGVNSA